MPRALHELIDDRRDELVARYVAAIEHLAPRAGLSEAELTDDVGAILNQFVEVLRHEAGLAPPPAAPANPSRLHGAQRLQLGSRLDDLIEEYGVLFDVVIRMAEESETPLAPVEVRALGRATNLAIAAAVAEYVFGHDAERRAEALFRERFIAILGHDLRSPLNALLLGATTLLRHDLSDGAASMLRRMVRSAERMERMIRDVLDFARARSGQFEVERRWMDAGDLAREIVDETRLSRAHASIEVEVDGAVDGRWDRDRLAQAVSNLVSNALDYGAPRTPARVRVADAGERVTIAVHNEGAPIGAEEMDRIFDPFRRGDRRERQGLGLGLFVTREIAHAHGGALQVTSDAERGTTFTLDLPRAAHG